MKSKGKYYLGFQSPDLPPFTGCLSKTVEDYNVVSKEVILSFVVFTGFPGKRGILRLCLYSLPAETEATVEEISHTHLFQLYKAKLSSLEM